VNEWIGKTPALRDAAKQLHMDMPEFSQWLAQALVKSGAARIDGTHLVDHG